MFVEGGKTTNFQKIITKSVLKQFSWNFHHMTGYFSSLIVNRDIVIWLTVIENKWVERNVNINIIKLLTKYKGKNEFINSTLCLTHEFLNTLS